MTIPLKQVIQAIEEANEVFTSFWDTKTGKTVYLSDPLMTDLTEEERARSTGSNSLCAITGWNSVGMIIWRRRIGSLRSAGAQRKAWSTRNEKGRTKSIAAKQR